MHVFYKKYKHISPYLAFFINLSLSSSKHVGLAHLCEHKTILQRWPNVGPMMYSQPRYQCRSDRLTLDLSLANIVLTILIS